MIRPKPSTRQPRLSAWLLASGLAITSALTLAGCGQPTVAPDPSNSPTIETPSPTPSPGPTWTADEQAGFEAARRLMAALDDFMTDPNMPITEMMTRIEQVAIDPGQAAFAEAMAANRQDGKIQIGRIVVDPITTHIDRTAIDRYQSYVDVCLDFNGVDVLGPDGQSLVQPTRKDRAPNRIFLTYIPEDDRYLVNNAMILPGDC